jgi:hypothetical protein
MLIRLTPGTLPAFLTGLLVLPNVYRCELRLAYMEISTYPRYAKERFETARPHSILHLDRIVGKSEVMRGSLSYRFREVG